MDPLTGDLHSWTPPPLNASVSAMILYEDTLFVGGSFTSPRNGLAAFDLGLESRDLLDWAPSVSGPVLSLLSHQDKLFVGGGFSEIDEYPSASRLAAFDLEEIGWPLEPSWLQVAPPTTGSIQALAAQDNTLFVGGSSYSTASFGGQGVLAAIHILSGAPASGFNAHLNPGSAVFSLLIHGSELYAGGDFSISGGGSSQSHLAALSVSSGGLLSEFAPTPGGRVDSLTLIAPDNLQLFVGGGFQVFGGVERKYLAAVDLATNTVTDWTPSPSGPVTSLVEYDSKLYVGGSFVNVAGQSRSRLASFDLRTGSLTDWNPSAAGTVNALLRHESTLYVGGLFTALGGNMRNRLASIDLTTGMVTAWAPSLNSYVDSLAHNGSELFVGGNFTIIDNSIPRERLASFDLSTGLLTEFNPSFNNPVETILATATRLFVGGQFTTINGNSRPRLASFDLISRQLEDWSPSPNFPVFDLALSEDQLIVAGGFSSISSTPRSGFAAFDLGTGALNPWSPSLSPSLWSTARPRSLLVEPGVVFTGGLFSAQEGPLGPGGGGLTGLLPP